jgi:molybdopterin converting factor small subunit
VDEPPRITVEFFGLARKRAGRAEVSVFASTVAAALAGISRECPALSEVLEDGRLSSRYLTAINAGPFLADMNRPLAPGDRLLLLGADAGG